MKCHLEGSFQSLDPLHGGPEAPFKFGQLTTEVSIITNKLLVDLEWKRGNLPLHHDSVKIKNWLCSEWSL